MENNDATVGSNLRRLREARGLSQAELAEALTEAGLPGFHPQTITKIEKGVRAVKLIEGVPMARLLGVEPEALVAASAAAVSSAALHRAVDKLIFSAGVAHNSITAAIRDLLTSRRKLEDMLTNNVGELRADAVSDVRRALGEMTVESAMAQGLSWHREEMSDHGEDRAIWTGQVHGADAPEGIMVGDVQPRDAKSGWYLDSAP